MIAYWKIKPEWTASTQSALIKLTADCCFVVDGVEHWIPESYECDGASIPRAVWWIPGIGTPTEGFNALGAWAHDAIYLTHKLTRTKADEIAYQLWLQAGKGKIAAKIMYCAIRTAGYFAWKNGVKEKLELLEACRLIKLRSREDQEMFRTLWPV